MKPIDTKAEAIRITKRIRAIIAEDGCHPPMDRTQLSEITELIEQNLNEIIKEAENDAAK